LAYWPIGLSELTAIVTSDGTIWRLSAIYFLNTQQGVSSAGANWTKIFASFFPAFGGKLFCHRACNE
jgi:hypothetical protein